MKKIFAIAAALLATAASAAPIAGGPHDMTRFDATSTADICYYCHTSHSQRTPNRPPMWARGQPNTAGYTFYTLSRGVTLTSLDSVSGGCMSCHDGQVAVGVTTKSALFTGGDFSTAQLTSANRGYVGTDLSNDHPVSVEMVAGNAGVVDPLLATGNGFRLYTTGGLSNVVTCGSCHEIHQDAGNTAPFLLRKNPSTEQFCSVCHANK